MEPCPFCRELIGGLDGLRSPYRFEGLAREAIHRFKYQHLKALALPLAGLLAEYLKSHPIPAEIVVPVPLHPRRLRERGYNQTELLARGLAKLLELPALHGCLVRRHHSLPQARTTSASQRRANVIGAFHSGEGVSGKAVLLIDDVCTTGATLGACAQALKAAGAASVWGLTLAREA